jgi:gamma-tubulin complex component 6
MKYGSREGHEHDVSDDTNTERPPYSLMNQAFAAAVEKVLEGYFCSLNTLPASIKLRRSVGQTDRPSIIPDRASCNSSSEVTLLEVYLHTEELRRHIKSLGNICFPKFAGLSLSEEGLTTDAKLEFENFPRGTDLLSYLYVRLRVSNHLLFTCEYLVLVLLNQLLNISLKCLVLYVYILPISLVCIP